MPAQRFRHKVSLPELPKGAERGIIEQFRRLENDLDEVRGAGKNAVFVLGKESYQAKLEDFAVIEAPAGGTLVTIPQGNADNITKVIRIALVGGILSPGVTVSIVGRKGTINGQDFLTLASPRLVELFSVGERGWFYSI